MTAHDILARCDDLAAFSDDPDRLTRLFLTPAMREVHAAVGEWMRTAGLSVRIDAVGNIIGRSPGPDATFLLGSHLDTVPGAGKYDGILGVVLAIAAAGRLRHERLPFAIEVIGFSEEEGIRFHASYLGSKAVSGCFESELLARTDAAGITLRDAIANFGLDPTAIASAAYRPGQVIGYLEAHIEQGPILESKCRSLGVVEAIIGQSRLWLTFDGHAGHAGTQPMDLRRDALTAAAEWIGVVEHLANTTDGLRATVGTLTVSPGAVNVVPGGVRLSLDVRHASDAVRERAANDLVLRAKAIGGRRRVAVTVTRTEHHAAVAADSHLTNLLAASAARYDPFRMVSGAGHDAAIMARLTPMTMLFLRSPGGVSHHPSEAVVAEDVDAALEVMVEFLRRLASRNSGDLS